ncbi:uncharacterized protein MONOS_15480 [Monocercomonoides exilis]|uniref:uncharacterized protein n=1 Tax=Monocercomonoides exilis TaxID=2049356 RepID=UPI003559F3C4|nr:hypothetical protein MONOS_15480 [Monocercomonoides exilis]|eukprot:MONOS_15480.1-p1 / transcript=MONOS_15480.1 / gene=MONOS_15480 / organism=Monocercomonoides_exilis_PA203 / gene_product=unspecified product / transcript_product=unspecified product / location=Mono_scaffold01244:9948-11400(-) / protein_length=441 / sequence_SO=supercontig / SO=protein_coding / is_pseudo=false
MSLSEDDKCEKGVQAMTRTKKFSKLFCELEGCREDEQKQKIKEMNEMINEMNEGEFKSVFTVELFDKILQMIEEKTLSLERATLLLKHVGYCKKLKCFFCYSFDKSSLSRRMREKIIDENEKIKVEKDEMLLIELCECFAWLNEDFISKELFSVIVPRLLKVASKKDENEETQKEVEMALLALSHISTCYEMKRELYLKEIKEIIEYHQEHRNLTRLAYQTVWKFLMSRFFNDDSLEEVIADELHFAREAAKELKELGNSVDWKRKEERRKETKVKEVSVIKRWLDVISEFTFSCTLRNGELEGLFCSLVQVFKASRDNYPDAFRRCINSLRNASENKDVKIDDLLKSGTVGLYMEEMKQSTLEDGIISDCLHFFMSIPERLKEKTNEESEEVKRKEMKREILEKMEEEGYEDIIASLYGFISFVKENDIVNYQETLLNI